jgi:hypothetical protein
MLAVELRRGRETQDDCGLTHRGTACWFFMMIQRNSNARPRKEIEVALCNQDAIREQKKRVSLSVNVE